MLAELVEAAARGGKPERAAGPLERLAEIAEANGTDWALGILARSRALLSEGEAAERLYREAIERLGRTRIRVAPAARCCSTASGCAARTAASTPASSSAPRTRCSSEIGMEGFAERARRELLATGETVRKRTVETLDDLTPQEPQIAQLAADGRTNPEIGAQLFLSPRTVEWHLRKVFGKLGISSRRELRVGAARRPRDRPDGVKRAPPPAGPSGPADQRRSSAGRDHAVGLLHVRVGGRVGLRGGVAVLASGEVGRVPVPPVVLRGDGLEGAVVLGGLGQQLGQRGGVGALDAAGQPLADLLELPLVAVRVREDRAGEVRAALGSRPGTGPLPGSRCQISPTSTPRETRSSRAASMSSTTRSRPWCGLGHRRRAARRTGSTRASRAG